MFNETTIDKPLYLCAKRGGVSYLNATHVDDAGECPDGKVPCSIETTGMKTVCVSDLG